MSRNIDVYAECDRSILFLEASIEGLDTQKIDSIKGKHADYKRHLLPLARREKKNVGHVFFTNSKKDLNKKRKALESCGIKLLTEDFLDYISILLQSYPDTRFAYHHFLSHVFHGEIMLN